MNEPIGRFGSCRAGAGAPDRGRDRMHGFRLPDYALAEIEVGEVVRVGKGEAEILSIGQ